MMLATCAPRRTCVPCLFFPLLQMKISLVILLLLMLSPRTACAQCADINTTTRSGEWARYEVYYNWGFIWMNAAEVVFSTQTVLHSGQPMLQLEAQGRTYPRYDTFYTVRDTFRSVVDAEHLTPKHFYQSNYEGSRITRNTYLFDADSSLVSGHSFVKAKGEEQRSFALPWDGCSFDVLTMVYKARNISFDSYAVGDKIPISMIINAECYPLYIRYLGREEVTTRAGRTFRCLKFTPLLVDGTIFAGGEDMTVWVTDDANRVPVVIDAKVLMGSVKAMFSSGGGFVAPLTAEVVCR